TGKDGPRSNRLKQEELQSKQIPFKDLAGFRPAALLPRYLLSGTGDDRSLRRQRHQITVWASSC
ncbi:MAG TPA: hypothetical protein P5300_03960, partial [Acidobacteriota bacterium]|nr:hypothetical protein [Acidobacteriota bacterium]